MQRKQHPKLGRFLRECLSGFAFQPRPSHKQNTTKLRETEFNACRAVNTIMNILIWFSRVVTISFDSLGNMKNHMKLTFAEGGGVSFQIEWTVYSWILQFRMYRHYYSILLITVVPWGSNWYKGSFIIYKSSLATLLSMLIMI